MIKNIKWLCLVALTIIACNKKDDDVVNYGSSDGKPLTFGTADFSKYVALGNSLSAGFSDNALFIEGQKTAWTSILAQQFKTVGGGEFKIPFMADNVGGFSGSTTFTPRLYLVPPAGPGLNPTISSVALPPYRQVATTNAAIVLTGGFNNMGVPGAKSFHLGAPGYGQLNPYFGRFASSPTASVIGDAVAQNATFFSLWIGNNDVLGYASSGGTGTNQLTNTNPTTYGQNDITNTNVFAATYNALLSDQTGLRKNGAKGVVANIPYVTSIPLFTTVPFNALPLNATQVAQLTAGYNQYNLVLQQAVIGNLMTQAEANSRTITFTVGQNAVVIIDEYLATDLTVLNPALIKMRQATASDLILLSSQGTSVQAHLAGGNGSQFPLQDRWVLSKGEIAELKTATDAFNMTIKTLASQYGLAFVDANALLNQVATTGVTANGYTVKSNYITGGGFSLDGVHPSPRGYALIANEFIKEINKTYGSNMSPVSLANYRILFGATL